MNIAVGSKEWINNEFLPSSLSLWALAEVNAMYIHTLLYMFMYDTVVPLLTRHELTQLRVLNVVIGIVKMCSGHFQDSGQ